MDTLIKHAIQPIESELLQLHVIGLGIGDDLQLNSAARHALAQCDWLIGSQRQLALIDSTLCSATRFKLPKLAQLAALLSSAKGLNVVMLASGDPLFYGIGRWLAQHISPPQLRFYPQISSIQAACHQLGKSLQEVTVVSLHGRPLSSIRRHLVPRSHPYTLVILTDAQSTPPHLAQECHLAHLSKTQLIVCEALGFKEQRVRRFTLDELLTNQSSNQSSNQLSNQEPSFHPLHVTVLEIPAHPSNLAMYPAYLGFDDRQLISDKPEGSGMFTKREVRLQIVADLAPQPNEVIWDIGAGIGGVAIELSLHHAATQIIAIEQQPQRVQLLKANQKKFGVTNLSIVEATAPQGLAHLPAPNKIFIGGSSGQLDALLHFAWAQLPIAGTLVVSLVTQPSRAIMQQFCQHLCQQPSTRTDCLPFDLQLSTTSEIAVQRGQFSAEGAMNFKQKRPVQIVKLIKAIRIQSND